MYAVNLRFDLARLSDSELAKELDLSIDYRRATYGDTPIMGSLQGHFRYGFVDFPDLRGLVRARWAYRLASGYFGPFKKVASYQHLLDCEILDLLDETERRVRLRKRSTE